MFQVRIDVVTTRELGREEQRLWKRLQTGNPVLDSPFLSWEFVSAVAAVRDDVHVAVATDDSGGTGFFPFHRHRRTGRALGMGLSDVQGFVAPALWEISTEALLPACDLRLLRFDHLLAAQEQLLTPLPSRLALEQSPLVDVTSGLDAYLAERRNVSKSLFQSTARKRRKLERECGPVQLTFHEADHRTLELVLRWKSEQYRRTGRRDRFAVPTTRQLVHDLLEVDQPGFGAVLTTLRAGDTVVAAHLGLRSSSTLAWWFPVYDATYAPYSPGLVLCLDLISAMPGEGLAVLDLGKGDEPYKDRLSNRSLRLLSGTVATRRRTQAWETVRRWPVERATSTVLESPRLRRTARAALAQVGRTRTAARRS